MKDDKTSQGSDRLMIPKYLTGFILIALFWFVPAPGLAADISAPAADSRYVDIYSGAVLTGQFDKQSFRYEQDPYQGKALINVWIKAYASSNDGTYHLNRYLFDMEDRKVMLINASTFTANGQVIASTPYTYNADRWNVIVPGTDTDTWYEAVMRYAKDNNKTLMANYKKRTDDVIRDSHSNWLTSIVHIFDPFTNN